MYFIEKIRAFLDFIDKNDTIAQILCIVSRSLQKRRKCSFDGEATILMIRPA